MQGYEGFADTYYAKQQIAALNLGVDFSADDFKAGLAEGLRFIAANETPVLVHCTEGKDRVGFAVAVLEALMGASAEEITADYMVTFQNFYGVQPGTEQYSVIASSNIQKILAAAFGMTSIFEGDLQAAAVSYLTAIGLTADEIAAVQAKLGPDQAAPAAEETPAAEEAPAVEETPATEEAVIVVETPAAEEGIVVVVDIPAAEEAPAVEKAPLPEIPGFKAIVF